MNESRRNLKVYVHFQIFIDCKLLWISDEKKGHHRFQSQFLLDEMFLRREKFQDGTFFKSFFYDVISEIKFHDE